jgi:phosphoglycerate dehydrogenase-like enzyme
VAAERPTLVVLGPADPRFEGWFAPLESRVEVLVGHTGPAFEAALGRAEAIFAWGKPKEAFEAVVARAPRLRWVHSTGAGVEHLLAPGLRRRRVVLTNSRGLYSHMVSEMALALLLAWAKRVPERLQAQREHRWQPGATHGLRGSTMVIVGLGSIGAALGVAARGLGMHVVGVRRSVRPSRAAHEVVDDLHAVLPRANVLAVCCPETSATIGLIGRRELALLPAGACVVNVARGSVVDEEALIDALRSGHLGGAGLDVFATEPLPPDSPLWDLPGVVISPHYPNVEGYERETIRLFLENTNRFLRGQRLLNVVNQRRGY